MPETIIFGALQELVDEFRDHAKEWRADVAVTIVRFVGFPMSVHRERVRERVGG